MNEREQQLNRDVMRRVRLIHTMRFLLTPGMIKGLVFLASCVSVLFLVSIASVLENMSHLSHVAAYAPYIFNAYIQTSWSVELVIILALLAGAWLARDILYGWSTQRNLLRSFVRS